MPSIKDLLGRVYANLPKAVRYGRAFQETSRLLKESQGWDEKTIEAHQLRELRRLAEHCDRNVPYYSESFRKAGFVPVDLKSIRDLESLPLLDKAQISAHAEALTSRNFAKRDLISVTTGGSTGLPLRFFQQRSFSWDREQAFISTMWERIGFRYGTDARLVLRGTIVARPGGIRYKPATREYFCSTYSTAPGHLENYLRLLKEKKIRFIHGHVSSIAIFAQHVLSTGQRIPLQGVLGGSEKVYPFQREWVEKAFGCRLFSWYGQSEQVALAGECEHSDKYHIFPEYGVLELVDGEGKAIHQPGKIGEIVGTGFNNFAMPMLRYRTGDLASFAEGHCPGCLRKYRLLERVEGRNYEYVVTRSGNPVSLTGLIFGQHFQAFGCINKIQVYQDEPGRLELRIVPGAGFVKVAVEEEIRGKIRAAVGSEIDVEFSIVDSIEPSASGKHRFLIQKLAAIGKQSLSPESGA
jgi:phenylacetate-CoA ligase